MSDRYSVFDALRSWKAGRKAAGKNPHSLKTVGPEILPAFSATPAIQPFCLHLKSFAAKTSVLPDDFDTVDRSSKGLKAHVRPDGACYVAAVEFAGDDVGVIIVYGDPLMSVGDAKEHARRFRQQFEHQLDTYDAAKSLGPFAGKPSMEL